MFLYFWALWIIFSLMLPFSTTTSHRNSHNYFSGYYNGWVKTKRMVVDKEKQTHWMWLHLKCQAKLNVGVSIKISSQAAKKTKKQNKNKCGKINTEWKYNLKQWSPDLVHLQDQIICSIIMWNYWIRCRLSCLNEKVSHELELKPHACCSIRILEVIRTDRIA